MVTPKKQILFLATTALHEFWKTDVPILFLGGWCLKFQERPLWNSLSYEVMESPWNNSDQLSRAIDYCDGIYESTLECLVRHLNQIHNTRFSKRYWRIIIGPWLLYYIHVLYDRFISLDMAFRQFPGLSTLVLEKSSYVTPVDFFDYYTRSADDQYNLQLYSQILDCLGFSFPSKFLSKPTLTKKKYDRKRRVKIFLKSMYGLILRLCSPNFPILLFDIHFKQSDVWRLCWHARFKTWAMTCEGKYKSGIENVPIDNGIRSELANIQCNSRDPFTDIVIKTLSVNMPVCYVEGYSKMRDSARKIFTRNIRGVMSSFGWFSNEKFKFFAAESSEKGAFLCSIQHGGASGVNKYTAGDVHMMKSSDVYFSWGKAYQNVAIAASVPDPQIQRLRKSKKIPFHDSMPALFVGTIFPRYLQYLRYCPFGQRGEDYILWQVRFLGALPESIRSRFIVRLSADDFDWSNKSRIAEHFPELYFDDHTLSYQKQLKNCKLAVVDNCQTTFLEALLLNRPVILFYDPNLWGILETTMPYIDLLHDAGILLHTPEEAADKVSEVFEKPDKWWFSEKIQSVREEYVDHLALSDEDWITAWEQKLFSLKRRNVCV